MEKVLFDCFLVKKRIAFGAFSVVYQVVEKGGDENMIAIKVEQKDSGSHLLQYEFELGRSLFGLPNILKLYNIFENDREIGVAMDLMFDVLSNIRNKRKNPPSIPMLLNVTNECLIGLKSLHDRNILHHDLKPSNLGVVFNDDFSDYNIVLFDFGLSVSENEPEYITKFRNKLDPNPRYYPLNNHAEYETKCEWNQTSDIISLIYSIADFWRGVLPWDGRTTSKLIYEEKKSHSLESLLPEELGFLVEGVEMGVDYLLEQNQKKLSCFNRSIDEEIHYLSDPQDKGYQKKAAELVFDPEMKKQFKNQHSA